MKIDKFKLKAKCKHKRPEINKKLFFPYMYEYCPPDLPPPPIPESDMDPLESKHTKSVKDDLDWNQNASKKKHEIHFKIFFCVWQNAPKQVNSKNII